MRKHSTKLRERGPYEKEKNKLEPRESIKTSKVLEVECGHHQEGDCPGREAILFPTNMKLLLLLLCLGLTLVCGHAEEANSERGNLDVDKLNGDWFSIVVASDKREKIEQNGSMRFFVQHIDVLENSLGFKLCIK
nr:alpha2u globulin isoform X1 [Rattus norvegicus]